MGKNDGQFPKIVCINLYLIHYFCNKEIKMENEQAWVKSGVDGLEWDDVFTEDWKIYEEEENE